MKRRVQSPTICETSIQFSYIDRLHETGFSCGDFGCLRNQISMKKSEKLELERNIKKSLHNFNINKNSLSLLKLSSVDFILLLSGLYFSDVFIYLWLRKLNQNLHSRTQSHVKQQNQRSRKLSFSEVVHWDASDDLVAAGLMICRRQCWPTADDAGNPPWGCRVRHGAQETFIDVVNPIIGSIRPLYLYRHPSSTVPTGNVLALNWGNANIVVARVE